MIFIIDIAIVVIIALCVLMGYKKGLTGCIIKLLSFFIAIVVAFILFKPAAQIIISNTQVDENIHNSIVQVFEKDDDKENEENKKVSPILKSVSDEIENATEEKKSEIINNAATEISNNVVNALAFIIIFILVRFALIFIKAITDLITKLPLIKQCDKIGGIIYGLLQGLVIVFIALALITLISTITNNYAIMEMINQSYIASLLCNNNLLVNLIF